LTGRGAIADTSSYIWFLDEYTRPKQLKG